MTHSRLSYPLRLSLRGARAALQTTRDVADFGLAALELVGQALGDEPAHARARTERSSPAATNGAGDGGSVADGLAAFAPDLAMVDLDVEVGEVPPDIVYVDGADDADDDADAAFAPADDAFAPLADVVELAEEVAEPGAETGAGASIRIAAPFDGYDALRAPDVIAGLRAGDAATLAAIELYERAHRARKTVLDAVAREARRRG